jgi:hypothetical protein
MIFALEINLICSLEQRWQPIVHYSHLKNTTKISTVEKIFLSEICTTRRYIPVDREDKFWSI